MIKGLSITTDSFVKKDAFEGSHMQNQIKPLRLAEIPKFSEPSTNDLEEFKKLWISKSSEGQEEDGTTVVDGTFKEKLQELLGIQESGIREAIENARRYAVGVPGTLTKISHKDIQEKLNEMEYTVERAVHCALVGNEIDAATKLNKQAMELEREFRKVVSGFNEILNPKEESTCSKTEEFSMNGGMTQIISRNASKTEKLTRISNTTGECSTNDSPIEGFYVNGTSNGVCSGNSSSAEERVETEAENKLKNVLATNEVSSSKSVAENGPESIVEEYTGNRGEYNAKNDKNLSGFYIGKIPEGDREAIKCKTNSLGGRTPLEEALRLLSTDENKAVGEAFSVLLDTKHNVPLTQLIACRALSETARKRRRPVPSNGDKRLVENFKGGHTIWIPDSWYSLICCGEDYTEVSVLSRLVKKNGSGKVKIEDTMMKQVDDGMDTNLSKMEGVWFKASKGLQERNDVDWDTHVSAELSFDSLLLYFLLTGHYTVYAVEIQQCNNRCTSRFVVCRSNDQNISPDWVPYKFMQPGGPWYVKKDEKKRTIVNKCASRIRRCNAMTMPVKHELEIFFKLDAKLKRKLCDKLMFVPDPLNESFDGEGSK